MLSALSSPADMNSSMEAGADMYLVKPFDFDTLIGCIGSLTTSQASPETPVIAVADIIVDRARNMAFRDNVRLDLTTHEFSLLRYFATHPGERIAAETISSEVLGMTHDPRSNIVDVLVRLLAGKIDAGREAGLIESLDGRGFRFAARRIATN
jgi:DNA-binding response OmpR family regulator